MDCTVTPLKTLMGFSVHLNVQLKFYNLPKQKIYYRFWLEVSPLKSPITQLTDSHYLNDAVALRILEVDG